MMWVVAQRQSLLLVLLCIALLSAVEVRASLGDRLPEFKTCVSVSWLVA